MSVIFIKPETNWYMVSSDFHFQFNTTIDLNCTLIGHFRAYIRCMFHQDLMLDEAEVKTEISGNLKNSVGIQVIITNKSDMS